MSSGRSARPAPHSADSAAQFVAEAGRDWVGTVTVLIPEPGASDYFGRARVEGRALVVAVYVRPSHRAAACSMR